MYNMSNADFSITAKTKHRLSNIKYLNFLAQKNDICSIKFGSFPNFLCSLYSNGILFVWLILKA